MSPLPETSPEPARLSHAGPGLATECTREVFEVSFDIFSALPKPRVIQGIEADTKNGAEPSGLSAWSRARQSRQKLRTGGLHKLKEVGAGVRPPKVTFLSEKKNSGKRLGHHSCSVLCLHKQKTYAYFWSCGVGLDRIEPRILYMLGKSSTTKLHQRTNRDTFGGGGCCEPHQC